MENRARTQKICRRDFLNMVSGGTAALVVGDVLSGCGGGGGGGEMATGGTAPPSRITGTVNPSEIGGSGNTVTCITNANQAVGKAGAFTISAPATGAGLVVVTDSSGGLRAAAWFIPGNAVALTIDAGTTAVALCMLTPGILSTTQAEASQRVSQLMALSTFGPLHAFLKASLPSSTLQTLLAQQQLPALLTACISQWVAGSGSKQITSADGLITGEFITNSGFTPTSASVQLANSAWRWVQVAHEPLGSAKNALAPGSLAVSTFGTGLMPGASAASWGSLFVGGAGSPSSLTDTGLDLTNPTGQAFVEYSAQCGGPLYAPGMFPPLQNGQSSVPNVAFGVTLVTYLVFPILDAVTLGLTHLLYDFERAKLAWDIVSADLAITNAISTAAAAPSLAAFFTAVVDVAVAIFTFAVGAEGAALLKLLGFLPAWVKAIPITIGAVEALLGLYNLSKAAQYFYSAPPVSTVTLPVPAGYTYTYTGGYFNASYALNGLWGGLTPASRITASVTLADPLPSTGVSVCYFNYVEYTGAGVVEPSNMPLPTSFVFSDGVHTFTTGNSTAYGLQFTTMNGRITHWYCFLFATTGPLPWEHDPGWVLGTLFEPQGPGEDFSHTLGGSDLGAFAPSGAWSAVR